MSHELQDFFIQALFLRDTFAYVECLGQEVKINGTLRKTNGWNPEMDGGEHDMSFPFHFGMILRFFKPLVFHGADPSYHNHRSGK